MSDTPDRAAHFVAGLLSTLDFRPAECHPQDCLPMARLVLKALDEYDRTHPEGT